jgi:cobalt-zinc-cadmium efflux system membrane fusion protein
VVKLGEAEQREFGIEVGTAGSGPLRLHVTLPGDVALNADRRAHVVPRVSGVVQAVHQTLGDVVRVGDVLAVLDSRELADLKSAYLTAAAQVDLAQATFNRETDLRQQKISSEQELLQAKQELAAAKISKRAAAQKLRALGFTDPDIARLSQQPSETFTHYAITAPFDGTIIERHISLGEVLQDDAAAFVVADLSTVWVDLRVYPKDLPFVRVGQAAVISAGSGIPEVEGSIAYVGPVVGEQTRTALARVVLPNPDGLWRPGLFVTAVVDVESREVAFLVPQTALQTIEDQPAVFIQTSEGFVPQPVTLGQKNDTYIEVTHGLAPGQRYVTRGAFTLKAQLAKGSFGDGHNH